MVKKTNKNTAVEIDKTNEPETPAVLDYSSSLLPQRKTKSHDNSLNDDLIVSLGEQPVTSVDDLHSALVRARTEREEWRALCAATRGPSVPAALVTSRLSDARHAQAEHALRGGRHLPDGRLPALLTGVTLLVGAVEMAYLLAG